MLVAEDVKGSVARIATILAEHGINIATLRLTRKERGGDAFMVIEVDEPPGEGVRDEIRALRWVRWAFRLDKVSEGGRRRPCIDVARRRRSATAATRARPNHARAGRARDGGEGSGAAGRGDPRRACDARLAVMRGAVGDGLDGDLRSASGLVGGDAAKLRTGPAGPLAGTPFRDVLARALAVQEVNAAMGVIVAAPTAGGAGVLPAVLTGLADGESVSDDKLVDALATRG